MDERLLTARGMRAESSHTKVRVSYVCSHRRPYVGFVFNSSVSRLKGPSTQRGRSERLVRERNIPRYQVALTLMAERALIHVT